MSYDGLPLDANNIRQMLEAHFSTPVEVYNWEKMQATGSVCFRKGNWLVAIHQDMILYKSLYTCFEHVRNQFVKIDQYDLADEFVGPQIPAILKWSKMPDAWI